MLEQGRWRHQAAYTPSDPSGGRCLRDLSALMLDAAGGHVAHLGLSIPELQQRKLTWMLSRLLIRVQRPPAVGERLTVTTWPSGIARLFALREFTISGGDGAHLALATSGWLLVDLGARRPVRPDFLIGDLPVSGRALDVDFGKLDGDFAPAWRFRRSAQAEDIDVNGHLTTTTYVAWIEGALREGRVTSRAVGELEVHFLAEVFRNDTVRVECADAPTGDACDVRIIREADDSVAARARARWGAGGSASL
jgi:medium-chain acyl-[acyl-carrier-protein] hydrolase